MREYKFRAWHKANKEMIYFDNEIASKDPFQSSAILRLMAGDKSGVLMQFTGLKDSNNKEIYEGDVVSHLFDFGKGKGIVSYWGSEFKLESKAGTCDEIDICSTRIIGNIYANPELIVDT